MFDALVFSSVNALEFWEVRRNAIRIPEVIQKVRDAQMFWDQKSDRSFDLVNFIGSDDKGFLGNLRLKNLATAVVQLGLLDRLLKQATLPQFLLGLSNGDSALKVAARQQTFDELINASQAFGVVRAPVSLNSGLPVLTGVSLAEFSLLEKTAHGYEAICESEKDPRRAMAQLLKHPEVRRIVVVGPGAGHVQAMVKSLGASGVEAVDSTTLDPILSWFWDESGPARAAAFQ